ncbi:catalytic phage domain protein : Site-specific recombinase XerD OS=Singulisphaera acidiphila (strain ATCC BAA-1392 / DSM 18658 / VKM B-2454 / MOB10) GN=Sinac_1635 PE=4 SV=1: Phage_integrase [Gemmataceae bacterium]|nr:catalytic phage domain protein : Site-specific recombinase XerD OS=Singulisphaera acidiphila (strain ATCC BAA-1392 / DSM 18658 / VKM B-2454 / MOB10) GN=Sinac_1635 PE=4 SV=1: Phage_integrase [Gemmataceae bacterium]VTT96593.1 catalytic phage domain protein : Site-specific recombinase XerD OS=Singulisphaera acidiphila (strain ATCC BAA-1392 / DSM 18658 / VKM B-2454 / MOB10) GN=Sinac_1635 PE=4 SV=1: Phage_integrase [Gemmataceae bacterium]
MSKQPIPQLRYHTPTKQHYVWWNKKRVHLGADPAQAELRYKRIVAELASDRDPFDGHRTAAGAPAAPPAARTVSEVLLAHYRHLKAEGRDRSALHRAWQAAAAVLARHPALPAAQFRGPQLKQVRADLLARPELSRTYINYLTRCVQRAWAWAASEDLVPPEAAEALRAVEMLRRGRGGREPARVVPPPAGWDGVLSELSRVTSAMVQVQALGGMRPQDVCRMRRGDVSTGPHEPVLFPGTARPVTAFPAGGVLVWLYVPREHKTAHLEKPRAVALGPRAQQLLRPLLAGLGPDDYVFSPARSLAEHGRGNRFKRQGYATCYATRQYAQLVGRAIDRVNAARVAAGVPVEDHVPWWSPLQLRHLAATVVGDEIDREHARALLGHSSQDVIERYMEQQLGKAGRAAAECG